MASLKDIRKRIDSVKKTQKTTSAMNMAVSYTHLTLPTTPYV